MSRDANICRALADWHAVRWYAVSAATARGLGLEHDLCRHAPFKHVMAAYVDLRGKGAPTGDTSVLADPSGRRRRRLTRMGRIVAGALVVWLCGLVGAGLGLLPAPIVPFASSVDPQSSPPRMSRLPAPRPPSMAVLRPAAPAPTPRSGTRASGTPAPARTLIGHRDVPRLRSRGGPRARPAPAPSGLGGLTAPALLRAANAPGHFAAGAPGRAGTAIPLGTARRPQSAPGQSSGSSTTQTTTSPSLTGASGSAPGHSEVHSHEKTVPAPQR